MDWRYLFGDFLERVQEISIEEYWKQYMDREVLEYSYVRQFELYKERTMKEKVEMPNKSTVLAVARKCPDAKEMLKGLFPEAFEEKEICLISGQIYRFENHSGKYYLLFSSTINEWTLLNLKTRDSFWGFKQSAKWMKNTIKEKFTPCSNATIMVKDND